MESKNKNCGEVIRVYIAYWALGIFMARLGGVPLALYALVSLCVSVTFVFAYDLNEKIKKTPLRFIALLTLLLALMLDQYKVLLEFYFKYVCVVAFAHVGVAFACTYFFREKISVSPWKYLSVFLVLFLSMALLLLALPDPCSYVPPNKHAGAKPRQQVLCIREEEEIAEDTIAEDTGEGHEVEK